MKPSLRGLRDALGNCPGREIFFPSSNGRVGILCKYPYPMPHPRLLKYEHIKVSEVTLQLQHPQQATHEWLKIPRNFKTSSVQLPYPRKCCLIFYGEIITIRQLKGNAVAFSDKHLAQNKCHCYLNQAAISGIWNSTHGCYLQSSVLVTAQYFNNILQPNDCLKPNAESNCCTLCIFVLANLLCKHPPPPRN